MCDGFGVFGELPLADVFFATIGKCLHIIDSANHGSQNTRALLCIPSVGVTSTEIDTLSSKIKGKIV